MMKLTG
jgi:starch phosphorylase